MSTITYADNGDGKNKMGSLLYKVKQLIDNFLYIISNLLFHKINYNISLANIVVESNGFMLRYLI